MVSTNNLVDRRWIVVHGIESTIIHINSTSLFSAKSYDFIRTTVGVQNDYCAAAIPVSPDGPLVIGAIDDARRGEIEIDCDIAFFPLSSPGLWYLVVGNGEIMTAHTCTYETNFDTVMSVHSGICEALTCVGFDDDSCMSAASSVSWGTEPLVNYYIRIQSFGDWSQSGQFGLNVTSFPAAVNDRCDGAIALSTAAEVEGSMEGASGFSDLPPCSYDYSDPSLWYYIDGTGTGLKVSTCSPMNNFTGGMHVFKGSSCSDLICEGLQYIDWRNYGNHTDYFLDDYRCLDQAIAVNFFAEEDVRYYILLFSFDPAIGRANNTFSLNVTEFEIVDNDFCETAIAILDLSSNSDMSTIGSTYDAIPDNVECEYCYTTFSPGVWYFVMGTGAIMEASTCSSVLNFESSLQVFSGECGDLDSISHGVTDKLCKDSSYESTRAFFSSEIGVEYHILVGGAQSSAFGDFGLTIAEVEVPRNIFCGNAIALLPDSGITFGSMSNGTVAPPPWNYSCSYFYEIPRMWYSLNGTGDTYAITTCSSELNFDSGLSLSSGTCDSSYCLAFAPNEDNDCQNITYSAARVVFRSEVGVEYLIAVEGLNISSEVEGKFGLTMTRVELPPNDYCLRASVIRPDNGTIQGWIANVTATLETTNVCSFAENVPGVWYSLVGTGEDLAISTCSKELNFDSGISISSGTCEDQKCIISTANNDADCINSPYSGASVVLRTEVGVQYFILVEGLDYPLRGEFGLTVSAVEVHHKDICSDAIALQPNNGTIYGLLSNTTTSSLRTNYSCAYKADVPSVWYSLIGTGHEYSISTCSRDLRFDSVISVSTGPCDDQHCITCSCSSSPAFDCNATSFVAARVVFPTEVGVEYFVIVQGQNHSSHGAFRLTISGVFPFTNDKSALAMESRNSSKKSKSESSRSTTHPGFSLFILLLFVALPLLFWNA